MEAADFSGFATKANLKCSDGRTIMPEAFKHMDGIQVPLVWQHGHNNPDNILGHVKLKYRDNGDVYAFGFFNKTKSGQNAKEFVQHKDVDSLSIYANKLVERSKQVFHGMITEVSLVLSRANPGALIDYVQIAHGDGDIETLTDEAIIHTGLTLEFETQDEGEEVVVTHADGQTVRDIYDSMSEQQKNVVHFMLATALETAQGSDAAHSEEGKPAEGAPAEATKADEGDLKHQEGTADMGRNVFDQSAVKTAERHVISHADVQSIFEEMKKNGSLKTAVQDYALAHGIENIDLLFPDAKSVMDRPEFDKRRTEWVAKVINGTHHTPFSRIKSLYADLTLDEARGNGYVKGNLKKKEFFAIFRRITTPTTIYKRQKLDRDDVVDIIDFDVVAWLKFEMRLMLEEEVAVAALLGDGREVDDEDKINETNIRPIATDDDLYAATINVNLDDASSSYIEFLDAIVNARRFYKGTGTPTFFTTELVIAKLMTLRDLNGIRMFRTLAEVATELRVDEIVPVEPMERDTTLLGIMVNLQDYNIGADRGGEVTMFDDFDIDYNQLKYLIETRLSGALIKIRSALVFRKVAAAAALVVPVSPGFVAATNVITPATTTGVTYKRADTNATVTTGAPITLDSVTLPQLTIYAVPASASYYFGNNIEDEWTFDYVAP